MTGLLGIVSIQDSDWIVGKAALYHFFPGLFFKFFVTGVSFSKGTSVYNSFMLQNSIAKYKKSNIYECFSSRLLYQVVSLFVFCEFNYSSSGGS